MSENDRLHLVASGKKTDARVRRTRDALGDALVALMQEKPFETITVQDVLDRAKVGARLSIRTTATRTTC
jgi:AcrR family transcriptional regulator